MTTLSTANEVAEVASGWFETATRPDDEDRFTRLKDGAPEWMTQLVYDAHGGFLPDDWRYDCIRAAVDWIFESDDEEPDSSEFADSQVDAYTSSAIAWLASDLRRVSYCDEAAEELGGFSDGEYGRGGGERMGIAAMISLGQYAEAREVFESVLGSLEELAESEEVEA